MSRERFISTSAAGEQVMRSRCEFFGKRCNLAGANSEPRSQQRRLPGSGTTLRRNKKADATAAPLAPDASAYLMISHPAAAELLFILSSDLRNRGYHGSGTSS